jgi:hypothetical protein
MDYMTTKQAAEKWKISLRWVQTYLKENRIEGAVKFGHAWMIPINANKPTDGRLRKCKS